MSITDPTRDDVKNAWMQWNKAANEGRKTAAEEWRLMYLALLDRTGR